MLYEPRIPGGWVGPWLIYLCVALLIVGLLTACYPILQYIFTPVDPAMAAQSQREMVDQFMTWLNGASRYPAFYCCFALFQVAALVFIGIAVESQQ